MDVEIKQVEVQSVIPVRHRVLRKGKSLSKSYFEGDTLSTTYHFAAYLSDEVIGCTTLMFKLHDKINHTNIYQLRGMAVLDEYHGNNIGKKLLQHAEEYLKVKEIKIIWCNVRIKAVPFYSKYGYKNISDPFNIEDVGIHVLMQKRLKNA